MSKHRFYPALFVFLTLLALVAGACSLDGSGSSSTPPQPSTDQTQQQQQQSNTDAQSNAWKGIVPPKVVHSTELQNLTDRTDELNDPSHIAYLYYFTATLVYGPFVIQGKCSSTESQLTSPTQIVDGQDVLNGGGDHGYGSGQFFTGMAIPAPQQDGSYGQNENAIFCFTENGHKMLEFSGNWVLSDIPLVGLPTVNNASFGGK